jgi:hypothetical protein
MGPIPYVAPVFSDACLRLLRALVAAQHEEI